ncbi:MAG: ABC transporter permease [Rectinemataceae bacterium]|nr:ABC transporter permease [Rectinemataceae bacterium]
MMDAVRVVTSKKVRSSPFLNFVTRLIREKPLGTAGAVITILLLLTGIFANFLAPYGMNAQHFIDKLSPPSAKYLLGTDNLGRDILSRVIHGARITVIIGLSAATISTVISVAIGLLSGYIGGTFDLLVQRFVDAWMCLPIMIVLMVVISMIGPGITQVVIVMGVGFGIVGSRVVRGSVMSTKENAYIRAAVVIGCSTRRILWRHILPNIMAPVIILFTTRVPFMILTEASLSFLGYGVPPPAPSWGGMLSGSGRTYMFLAPWMVVWPGLALGIVVFGVNMFGDALRDILDPRLIGGAGRFGVARLVKGKNKSSSKTEDGSR